MSAPDNWDADAEERHALALAPIVKGLMDDLRSKLPDGTHFGLMILVPSKERNGLGRVLAATTDRDRMAPAIAQWCLSVAPTKRGRR